MSALVILPTARSPNWGTRRLSMSSRMVFLWDLRHSIDFSSYQVLANSLKRGVGLATPVPRSATACATLVASVAGAKDAKGLWGFIKRYAPEASPEANPDLDAAAGFAVRYFADRIARITKEQADDALGRALVAAVRQQQAAARRRIVARQLRQFLRKVLKAQVHGQALLVLQKDVAGFLQGGGLLGAFKNQLGGRQGLGHVDSRVDQCSQSPPSPHQ